MAQSRDSRPKTGPTRTTVLTGQVLSEPGDGYGFHVGVIKVDEMFEEFEGRHVRVTIEEWPETTQGVVTRKYYCNNVLCNAYTVKRSRDPNGKLECDTCGRGLREAGS